MSNDVSQKLLETTADLIVEMLDDNDDATAIAIVSLVVLAAQLRIKESPQKALARVVAGIRERERKKAIGAKIAASIPEPKE